MIKNIYLFVFGLIFLVVSVNCVFGFDYVLGTGFYEIPKLSVPGKGESVIDPYFHTTITKVTDEIIDEYYDDCMVFQYDTVPIENSDGTKLLLRGYGTSWYIYDAGSFKLEQAIRVREDGGDTWGQGEIEPQWDANDPNIFYYVMDRGMNKNNEQNFKCLYRYNISLPWNDINNRIIVHDFSNEYPWAYEVDTMDKGTPSEDGRYWALKAQKKWDDDANYQYAFVYDMQTDNIVSELDETSADTHIRWTSMSPSGKYVVIHYDLHPNIESGFGIMVFNRDDFSPIDHGDGNAWKRGAKAHGDLAIGTTGHDGWFGQNAAEDYIDWWDFETNTLTHLIKIPSPCCIGIHMSGNNYDRQGWGVVSTYDNHGVWMDEQIIMFELKENGTIWRLAHHQSNYSGEYWNQGHSTINRAGTKVYFHSTWGSSDRTMNEVYQLELPSTWYEDLSTPLETCTNLNGDCCSTGQSCSGGDFQLSSDCGNLCCVGGVCSDTTPPKRSDPKPTSDLSAGTDQTTISLATDESATCRYSTSPGVSYSSMPDTFSTTGGTTHSELIMDLTDGQTYNFYVRCSDSSGNHNTDDFMISFRVASENSNCNSGADTDDSDSVSIDELIAFIDTWKDGTISINQVVWAISEWKSGC